MNSVGWSRREELPVVPRDCHWLSRNPQIGSCSFQILRTDWWRRHDDGCHQQQIQLTFQLWSQVSDAWAMLPLIAEGILSAILSSWTKKALSMMGQFLRYMDLIRVNKLWVLWFCVADPPFLNLWLAVIPSNWGQIPSSEGQRTE